ncbi:MAG: prepilin-type N-terminal cleavage/methylation domain-containing protein [Crocinitomicaceae bacterium]|jgi:prepilin-type N-terminal cleavage/methylation domain-containing protein
MKINKSIRKAPKGVTLIELSVVIAVILVLISVLFIGATYYRDSANNAACVINQSSIRKAAESYMNIEGVVTVTTATLSGATGPMSAGLPDCPTGGVYALATAAGAVTSIACDDGHS